MELTLKTFNHAEELTVQRELFKECFPEAIGTSVISNEHYYWKFHSKKHSSLKSKEYAAYFEKDMIGYYAAIPYTYLYNGELINSAMVCDVMTGIKARGKGVFTKLGRYSTDELKEEGFDITTGYPVRPEVIPGHLKVGWEKTIKLPIYGRFISFTGFLKSKRLGIFAPPLNFSYTAFEKLIGLFKFSTKGYTVDSYNSKETDGIPDLQNFYYEWQKEIPISLIKDNDFIKWRLGAPEISYHILTLKHKERIVGVLIAREFDKDGIPCMGILDISMLNGFYSKSKILLDKLVEISRMNKRELILVMISSHWKKKYKLSQSFFLRTPINFYLIVKNLSNKLGANEIKNDKNWHVMWLDSDDL
jgi:hypothetical protein